MKPVTMRDKNLKPKCGIQISRNDIETIEHIMRQRKQDTIIVENAELTKFILDTDHLLIDLMGREEWEKSIKESQ